MVLVYVHIRGHHGKFRFLITGGLLAGEGDQVAQDGTKRLVRLRVPHTHDEAEFVDGKVGRVERLNDFKQAEALLTLFIKKK